MRDYATVSPRFWVGKTGKQIRAAGAAVQIVALYLMTSPNANMLGLYYLPIAYLAHETGLAPEAAQAALQKLREIGFCDYDDTAECAWVYEMAKFQIGAQLNEGDKRCTGVQREYLGLPVNRFLRPFFQKYVSRFHMTKPRDEMPEIDKPLGSPLEAPSMPLRSQEQEQEQELTTLSGKPELNASFKADAISILALLNERTGRGYKPVDANIELIAARLKDGATVDEVRAVVERKCQQWRGDEKMDEYLRPKTLFNRTNFAQYQGELGAKGSDWKAGMI
jgi:uncharacterized phage protein (TIGR02220 family)